jgi:hypothetical protein
MSYFLQGIRIWLWIIVIGFLTIGFIDWPNSYPQPTGPIQSWQSEQIDSGGVRK